MSHNGAAPHLPVSRLTALPRRSRDPAGSRWSDIKYATDGDGAPADRESGPGYKGLIAKDLDGDGVSEGQDSCAGISNPKQEDLNSNGFGDACDSDLDGDGIPNATNSGGSTSSVRSAALSMATTGADDTRSGDQFPYDTDNDGQDNKVDLDDDSDQVPDTSDNCVLVSNGPQVDTDGDSIGDACDLDDDQDSSPDQIEQFAGSKTLDGASTPELLGNGATCSDSADNDKDGQADSNDDGYNEGMQSFAQATISVVNVAPTIQSLTVPTNPVSVNTSVTASARFADPGTQDTHTATWDWGDGTTSSGSVTESGGSGSVTGSHTYTAAGSYTVKLTVKDDDDAASSPAEQTAIVTSGGATWTWGLNDYGQLGDGTTTDRSSPVQVNGLSGATGLAAGEHHSMAVK